MALTSVPGSDAPDGGWASRTTDVEYIFAGSTAYAAPRRRHTRKVTSATSQLARTVCRSCLISIWVPLLETPQRPHRASAPCARTVVRTGNDSAPQGGGGPPWPAVSP